MKQSKSPEATKVVKEPVLEVVPTSPKLDTVFPDQELIAVGFAKVPNAKGKFTKYVFHIKNNQVVKCEYGKPDFRDSAEWDARADFVNKLILKED